MNTTVRVMTLVALCEAAYPTVALAQDASVRQLFEAGQYQQLLDATSGTTEPEALFLAAQSQQKLGAQDEARATYGQLAARPDTDAWHFIGLSGQQLMAEQTDAALDAARQATALDAGLASAHYQTGLVLARRQEWQPAADAFDRTTELDPANAYAHYYSGLMHYQARRPDRMALAFERFLTLAPNAPERPEVQQIMRTVRGR